MLNHGEIEALLARVALGDRRAFSELYDATSSKLFSVALRILKQRAASEDAVQETYIKIWKNANRYHVSGLSPMSWLITICRNTSIDRLRARRHADDISDYADTLASGSLSGEQVILAKTEAGRIIECLDELDPDKRSAVTGAYLNGETYADLSKRLDVPLNTVRTWLRRSLLVLRECMSR